MIRTGISSWITLCVFSAAIVEAGARKVLAADHWVDPKGKDVGNGGTAKQPWATLQYAADRVRPGDTIHVRDGSYRGFYLDRGGTRAAPVHFKAEGQQVRIIQRNRGTPDGINVEGAGFVVIEGFIVNGLPRAGVRGALSPNLTIRRIHADRNGSWGILTGHCDDLAVIDNVVSNSVKEHGIYVANSGDRPIIRGNISYGNRLCGIHINGDVSQGGDGIISRALVENNVVFDNGRGGGSGINCDGVQESIIRNNLLYENHASGIALYRINGAEGSRNNRVINNTVLMASNAGWAIKIRYQSTDNLVWNNILLTNSRSNGSINIAADSLAGFRSDYNIVADRLSTDYGESVLSLKSWSSSTGLDRHSLVARPQELFVNAAAGDFHLRADSAAIDAADPAAAPPVDIEGTARPVGPRPDIGVYELREGMSGDKG